MLKSMKSTMMLVLLLLVVFACEEQKEQAEASLEINFDHFVDGQPLHLNNLIYQNAAGNSYEITEIQWFISELKLHGKDGAVHEIIPSREAHYIDTNVPSTLSFIAPVKFKPGEYAAVSFVLGLKGETNKPMRFTDPPESNMMWPYQLGGPEGGYHYMKLNGFWKDQQDLRKPFNFHLGVGQIYSEEKVSEGRIDEQVATCGKTSYRISNIIERYVQNWFEVSKEQSFSLQSNANIIKIKMNVENWFQSPHIYDHNVFGSDIMTNQTAMGIASENGKTNVFEIEFEK
jgi:hypothetical protein